MNISENALKVLERRYFTKNENGELTENVEGMLERVAKTISSADELLGEGTEANSYEKFYRIMDELLFLPNSPTLMNAGKELGQLSACFVLPVEDSMEGIFDAIKDAAIIHKSGGGTGFSFSRLRPKGSAVNSTGGVASGPISFMTVFNSATEAVKQGGTRRGANMGILRIDHPDILDFIKAKADTKELTNFNISVGITASFMKAVLEDKNYDLIDPSKGMIRGSLRAKEVYDLIVKMAWQNGEPGIIYLDRINESNPVPHLGNIESTNPCGEQPLLPYESCNLGSLNLAKFAQGGEVDFEGLGETVDIAVHFLDNVIEINKYPLKAIEEVTKQTRKIGLGVMGFADMLIELGIPYNSQKAVDLAEEVMEFIDKRSKQKSIELALKRGTYKAYKGSIHEQRGQKLRNATTTTIAPTGTISIIAGASSGVEPLFAVSYVRNVMDNDRLIEVHPIFERKAKELGIYSKELMLQIAEKGSLKDINGVPKELKEIFVTAHDIEPIWHIKMQAAFQRHVDNAVSKTVNFPHDATIEQVKEVYDLAYSLGLKGVTIYRDGSRDNQVLSVAPRVMDKPSFKSGGIVPRQRPDVTQGFTEKVKIGCGNLYITVNYDDDGICEVFANLGRAGGCPSQSEATSRLISIALRAGMDTREVVEQLKGIRCHSTLRKKVTNDEIKVLSCPDAIGKAIQRVAEICLNDNDKTPEEIAKEIERVSEEFEILSCPECGMELFNEGGCSICKSCGFSKCG